MVGLAIYPLRNFYVITIITIITIIKLYNQCKDKNVLPPRPSVKLKNHVKNYSVKLGDLHVMHGKEPVKLGKKSVKDSHSRIVNNYYKLESRK